MDSELGHSCAATQVKIPVCCAIGHGDHYQIRAAQSLIKPAKSIIEIAPLRDDETESLFNEDARVKKYIYS